MREIIRIMMRNEAEHRSIYDTEYNRGTKKKQDSYMRTGRKASPWFRETGFPDFLNFMRERCPPAEEFFSQNDILGEVVNREYEPWL